MVVAGARSRDVVDLGACRFERGGQWAEGDDAGGTFGFGGGEGLGLIGGREGYGVALESGDGRGGEVLLRRRAAGDGLVVQVAFRDELIEVRGRDDALDGTVLADEDDLLWRELLT